MDTNEYYGFMFRLMYADFCSAVRHEYKNLTSEEQQETENWLRSDKGKDYFLKELGRPASETERTRVILDDFIGGLEGQMRNMIEIGLKETFSKHDWQPARPHKRFAPLSNFS